MIIIIEIYIELFNLLYLAIVYIMKFMLFFIIIFIYRSFFASILQFIHNVVTILHFKIHSHVDTVGPCPLIDHVRLFLTKWVE